MLACMIFTIIVVVILRNASGADENIPAWELSALESLYDSAGGYHWEWKPLNESGNKWNFKVDANPCADRWQGIVCTTDPIDQYLHVLELSLGNYSMHGTLPAAIGNLTYLEVLSLPHNKLNGSIPDSPWATMPNLTTLDLGRNRLHGTIPPSLGQLSRLSMLILGVNRLGGSIPDALMNATQLTQLYLDTNRLTGTIPSDIGQLSNLEHLYLFGNLLNGSFPSNISRLSNLTELIVSRNNFGGTVPDELRLLSNLTQLGLSRCEYTGSIPAALCALQKLQGLSLKGNALTGTVPACVGGLTKLKALYFSANLLEGTLPPSLGNLTNMLSLDLSVNYFTGPIPVSHCALTQLLVFNNEYNALTGPLPPCLGTLTELRVFTVQDNFLDGSVPSAMWQLSNMVTFWILHNYFTGTIGDFRALRNLTELVVTRNLLTGTLPDSFESTPNLQALYFQKNLFSGTIPASLGTLSQAAAILLQNNILTGPLPNLSGLQSILQLELNDNHLSGALDGVFNASTQVAMLDVFLNDNQFTGTLPDELFRLPKLNAIVAQDNCFTGTLSAAMCESPAMVSLILDGLHTSTACRRELLSATRSYTTDRDVHGTIPPCLFETKTLISLHLAGNGLTGSLPAVASITPRLVDLTVSHNYLTGTIPAIIQSHIWKTLDLSYNRLSGSLGSELGTAFAETPGIVRNVTERSLSVQNNRLSGQIPSQLVNLPDVSVLGSNMFACKTDKSNLPKHDSDRDNYQCGSDAFNGPFYAALALIVVVLVLMVLVVHPLGDTSSIAALRRVLQRWSPSAEQLPPNVRAVVQSGDLLCRVGLCCAALILVMLVPWYAAASSGYSTYTYEYAWAVSAAFLSGVTPFETEFVLFCAILVVTASIYFYLLNNVGELGRITAEEVLPTKNHEERKGLPAWHRAAVYAAFLMINLAVVVGVNAGFVAIVLTQNNDVVAFAQILLSAFKLLWNSVGTPKLIAIVTHYLSPSEKRIGTSLMMVQVFLGLFNNIAIPCLVVAVLSPSCFYGVFDAAPSVTSSFIADNCLLFPHLVVCSERIIAVSTSTFSPPFRYNYQCSSSFITYYAPAFVYLGLAAGFAVPCFNLAKLWLYERTGSSPTGWFRSRLGRSIPPLLNQEAWSNSAADSPLFDAHTHYITLAAYLGILLTFGVVFPPLAVVMCATMLSVAWQTKLSLGRFLHFSREQGAPQLTEALDRDCKGAVSLVLLRRSIFLIMCFACCFYALFLFDTLGDAVGLSGAYWVLIVMPLLPVVLYGAMWVLLLHCARSGQRRKATQEVERADDGVVFEMTAVATQKTVAKDEEGGASVSGAEGRDVFNVLQMPSNSKSV